MMISELRDAAQQIWEAALDAARPEVCLPRSVRRTADGFSIGDTAVDLEGRLIVVGAGKASVGMALAVEDLFKDRITTGVVITKYGHRLPTRKVQVIEAGHPLPDRSGVLGVHRIRKLLRGLESRDVVLFLISGGGSALLPAPAPGVSLEEKQRVTSALLGSGATIEELNAVRKHLSAIKGGQLARWAAPARVVSLIMSDVIGDPVDVIASGPTAPDTTTFEEALEIVGRYRIDLPDGIAERLKRGAGGEILETPKENDAVFQRVSNHIIANNQLLLESASSKAEELGFTPLVLSSEIDGEARGVGRFFAAIAREIGLRGRPISSPACVLGAGETTVVVRGSGLGGRNQEMALAWAIRMTSWQHPVCFASVASDGTDGPTDGAGGLVDPQTCSRATALNLDPTASLQANDSFDILRSVGDLITTGPTQTNLSDLQILLAG